jgi:hypothetical protein
MNKLICCLLVIFSFSAIADEFEVYEPTGDSEFSDSSTAGEPAPAPMIERKDLDEVIVEDKPIVEEKKAEEKIVKEKEPVETFEDPFALPPSEPEQMAVLPKSDTGMAPLPVAKLEKKIESGDFKAREGHWLGTFAFEGMGYPLPFDFKEATKPKYRFKEKDRGLYGVRMGFGREIYLGGGFMTSSRGELYYLGTLFEKKKYIEDNGTKLDFSFVKDSGQIYGGEVVQTLSYLIDFGAKNPIMEESSRLVFEPFVEGGLGIGKSYNKKNYEFKVAGQTDERYKQSYDDTLANIKLGLGFQITSSEGYFLTVKVSQNQYIATTRESKTYKKPDGAPGVSTSDKQSGVSLDQITMFTLGGGYKF